MTVSRSKKFVFVDTNQNVSKKEVFIFGSIIASVCLSGSFLIAFYIEYLHNPVFHSFVQSRGIFLWILSWLILNFPDKKNSQIWELFYLFKIYQFLVINIHKERYRWLTWLANKWKMSPRFFSNFLSVKRNRVWFDLLLHMHQLKQYNQIELHSRWAFLRLPSQGQFFLCCWFE